MEPRAHFILIGAFTIAVAIGLLAFVIWLGSYAVDQDYHYYDIVFEDPVTGLGSSGAVMFNGIQVGEVQRLNLDPMDPSRVIARIRVFESTPVRADTSATLGYQGFTGLAFIDLEGGEPDSPMIEEISDREIPMIIAETSSLQALLNNSGTFLENISELVNRVTDIFSDENLESIRNMLNSIELTTEEVALHREAIGDSLEGLRMATDNANSMLVKLDNLAGDVSQTWSDNKNQIVADLNAITAETRSATEQANIAIQRLDGILARNEASIDDFAMNGLTSVATTLDDFSQLAKRLEKLASKLESNPGSILSGNIPEVEYSPVTN